MSYEQKDNDGVLFRNDKRDKDSQPHAKGSGMIGGVEYWISAWTNTSAKGDKYQKLAFEKKGQAPTRQPAPAEAAGGFDDSDVPFNKHPSWP